MAFKLIDSDNRSIFQLPIKKYDCTDHDDIRKLPRFNIPGTQVLNDGHDQIDNSPCGYGSTALVKDGSVYRLFPDNEWVNLS